MDQNVWARLGLFALVPVGLAMVVDKACLRFILGLPCNETSSHDVNQIEGCTQETKSNANIRAYPTHWIAHVLLPLLWYV